MSRIRKFRKRTYFGKQFPPCPLISKAAAEKECRPKTAPRPKETVFLTSRKKLVGAAIFQFLKGLKRHEKNKYGNIIIDMSIGK